MLSSSPSLLSALSPVSIAGGEAVASAAGEVAGGFAELLNGLAGKAVAAISGEKSGAQGDTEQPVAGDKPTANGKTIKAHTGRVAIAAKAADADGKDAPVADQPAAATLAAIESGIILPVALPEAAAGDDKTDASTKIDTLPTGAVATDAVTPDATATPSPVPVLPATLPLLAAQATTLEPAAAPASPSRRAAAATPGLANKVNAATNQPAAKDKPEAQAPEARPVAITVAANAPVQAATAVETIDARSAAPVRSKPARAADLARIEAPLPQASATQFIQADQSAQAVSGPAPITHTAMPSPHDIDAALDHLVAAREALMPAEASLAIDHAEFGEVSIRFEHSRDGRLSAELTAADPDLKRAVTAAVATQHNAATTPDGDAGRSAHLAGQRGSATTGGDASTGGRGQSGAGADRDLPQRHTPTRSPARQAATDQRPGVFA